jgi:hypothetical protein
MFTHLIGAFLKIDGKVIKETGSRIICSPFKKENYVLKQISDVPFGIFAFPHMQHTCWWMYRKWR